MTVPTLETKRLLLRAITPHDAATIHRLAGDRRLAGTTASIPIPYRRSTVEGWIRGLAAGALHGRLMLAIVLRSTVELVGVIGLVIESDRLVGNIDYWIGVPFWNRGLATEAAHEIMRYSFEELGLDEIQAIHLSLNPASGVVLRKLGMERISSSIDLVRGELEPIERYRLKRS